MNNAGKLDRVLRDKNTDAVVTDPEVVGSFKTFGSLRLGKSANYSAPSTSSIASATADFVAASGSLAASFKKRAEKAEIMAGLAPA